MDGFPNVVVDIDGLGCQREDCWSLNRCPTNLAVVTQTTGKGNRKGNQATNAGIFAI